MITVKKMGIWMNHSIAHIMEFAEGLITTIIVDSKPYESEKRFGASINESLYFSNEQYFQADYYKKLEESIKDCKEVILFGPTYAKVKLYYALREDKRFAKTKIGITQTDDMTITEQKEFVMNHFSNPFSFKQQYINN